MGEGDEGKELEPAKSIRSAETGKKSAGSEHSYTQGGKKSPLNNLSRQSGRVSFHDGKPGNESALKSSATLKNGHSSNPFKLPSDADIFMLRDKERKQKKEEREKQKGLRVHEKLSKQVTTNFRKMALGIDDTLEVTDDNEHALTVKDDPQFVLQVTRDRNIEKETLNEYVNKKREMFLVQYSLGVKRDEMRKLEEIASAEEKKLELAEQYLEEDATMFDEFLKENDKNSVEAIKVAEAETKAKMEKVIEIKRLNAQMMSVKSEISKCEETLKEYLHYKKFLDSLSPKEWLEEREAERKARVEEKKRQKQADRLRTPSSGITDLQLQKSKSGQNLMSRSNTNAAGLGANRNSSRNDTQVDDEVTVESDNEVDENPQLYFTSPQMLLDIFSELEEQNLSLIQNSQETEEALEEMKQTMRTTRAKMEKETSVLTEQIKKLETAIAREEEKAKDLKLKAQMFNFGEFKAEDQDSLIEELNKKVEEVYRACVGDNKANISTLQMLTNIENRLEELFEQIDMLPPDRVEIAKKERERERRLKMREEKIEQQRIHQEERLKKALERAQAEAVKKTGRRLVGRSQPPKMAQRIDKNAELISKEEEELAYYFNP